MVIQPIHDQVAQIVGLHGDVQPSEYLLVADSCIIGRSSVCQITVSRNLVSRIHARIEREGVRYVLHDYGSVNGTFVNNRRVHQPHLLKDRDLIGLGATIPTLRFIDPDPTFVSSSRIHYDEQTMLFFLDRQPLVLPPAQFRLFAHLYQHIGEVCSREQCAQVLWNRDYEPIADSDALDRAISKLRLALALIDHQQGATMIKTRRGLGYILVV